MADNKKTGGAAPAAAPAPETKPETKKVLCLHTFRVFDEDYESGKIYDVPAGDVEKYVAQQRQFTSALVPLFRLAEPEEVQVAELVAKSAAPVTPASGPDVPPAPELAAMKLEELRKIGVEKNVPNARDLGQAELIEALSKLA